MVAERDELASGPTDAVLDDETERSDLGRDVDLETPGPRSRPRLVRGTGLLAVIVIGLIGAGLAQGSHGSNVSLPVSPRTWLSAYDAAIIDSPAEVCTQLFSRQLAAVYARAAHGSCQRYFTRITSVSLKLLRVWRDSDTAVLDVRLVLSREEWAVVLDRQSNGWRAAALFGGHLPR
jgi:hypothetical protein